MVTDRTRAALGFFAALVGLVLGTPSKAQTTQLIGVTPVGFGNNAFLVDIDEMTGSATLLQPFAVNRGLDTGPIAWHDPTGSLLLLLPRTSGDGGELMRLSPGGGPVVSATITGLPVGVTDLGGIGYDSAGDQILVSVGATGTGQHDHVAELDLSGAVVRITGPLAVGSRDAITFAASSGDLLLCDFDGAAPRVASVTGLFGTPVFTPFANPPSSTTIRDIAYDPLFADAYVVDNNTFTLQRLVGNSYVTVGPLGIVDDIVGLEAVTCQFDLGGANSPLQLTVCGGTLATGSPAAITLFGGPPSTPAAILFGGNGPGIPLPPPLTGVLRPSPVFFTVPIVLSPQGFFGAPLPGGGGTFALTAQAAFLDLSAPSVGLSNALLITVLP